MFILIKLFLITHINNKIHDYKVFTFSILVYILTTIFTLKPHSKLLKNGKSSCSVYTNTIFYIDDRQHP